VIAREARVGGVREEVVRARVIDERPAAVDGGREEVRDQECGARGQAGRDGRAADARPEEEEERDQPEREHELRDLDVRLERVLEAVVAGREVVRPAEDVVVQHSSMRVTVRDKEGMKKESGGSDPACRKTLPW
jgi:hypothetical protein